MQPSSEVRALRAAVAALTVSVAFTAFATGFFAPQGGSGAAATPTLAAVLAEANASGGTNIAMSSTDAITFDTGEISYEGTFGIRGGTGNGSTFTVTGGSVTADGTPGGAIAVVGGQGGSAGAGGNGGAVTLTGGNGRGSAGNGGAATLDGGPSASGTTGTVTVGGTNASAVQIGRAGLTNGLQLVDGTQVDINATVGGGGDGAVQAAQVNIGSSSTNLTEAATGRLKLVGSNATCLQIYGSTSTHFMNLATTAQTVVSGYYIGFSSNASNPNVAADTGIARDSAGVLRSTDGSTGVGAFVSKLQVEDVTADNTLTQGETLKVVTNLGDADVQTETLPAAPATGTVYVFFVAVAQEMRIDPQAGDKIVDAGMTGLVDGEYITSSTLGSSITLVALSDDDWAVIQKSGTWAEETP